MGISLAKGQKISLEKEAGGTLSKVLMGLGWDAAKKKGLMGMFSSENSIDLDASCILFDEAKNVVDSVWFGQLKSKDGSVVHSGDNLTGAGEGDDEQIAVDLSRVPALVKSLVFVVNSFRGQTFDEVENAFCRLVDTVSNKEIAIYKLSGGGKHTGQVMAKLYRHEGTWKMHAIGEAANGRTVKDLVPVVKAFL